MADIGGVPAGMARGNLTVEAMQRLGQQEVVEQAAARQDNSEDALADLKDASNPLASLKKQESIKDKIQTTRKEKAKEAGDVIPIEEVKRKADEFTESHPEHDAKKLVALRQQMTPSDKKQEILNKIKSFYSDPVLINEALEFLLATTNGALKSEVQEAIKDFQKDNKLELTAGKNITQASRDAAKEGIAKTADEFRTTYTEYITAPEEDASTKFSNLLKEYKSIENFEPVMLKLLSSIGNALNVDKNSKTPSLERPQLMRLINEVKILQAMLGVKRYFDGVV